jgi:sRNA-binding regulator protein Hfq
MANSSSLARRNSHELRTDNPRLQSANSRTLISDQEGVHTGPRKLIRPVLPVRALKEASFAMRGESALLTHQAVMSTAPADQASHAEGFYFQKQMQMQTLMAFVLEDGEVIEGYIEWYDRYAIKVRNGSRTLIYKSSIKYLYKVGEGSGQ